MKNSFVTLPLLLLTGGHLVTDLTQGALPILLPQLKAIFSLSYAQIGLIVMTQNVTSSLVQPAFGWLSDKISLPWLIFVGVLLSGLGTAAAALAPAYSVILLAVACGGLGIAAFHPQASKSVYSITLPQNRGKSMGLFSVGGNLGIALGSIFMGQLLLFPPASFGISLFALPGILAAVLLWRNIERLQSRPLEAADPLAPTGAIQYSKLLVLLLFILIRSTIHTGMSTYMPLYHLDYLKGDATTASLLVSAFLLAGVAGTFFGAAASDRLGRKTVLLFSMILVFPLLLWFPSSSGSLSLLLVSLAGAFLVSSFATSMVLAQEMMPGYVGVASGLTSGFSIGLGGVGAALLGSIADHFGVPAVFTLLGLLPIAGAVIAAFLPGKLFSRADG